MRLFKVGIAQKKNIEDNKLERIIMNLNKTLLSAAVVTALTGAVAAPSQAAVLDMTYDGLFTMLTSAGAPLQNTSYPYYGDTTWGYGIRTQISGTMQFDTATGYGTGTVTPFAFYDGGDAVASGIEFQSIGGNLMIGNMNFAWNNNDIATQIVLDGSGLFNAMNTYGLPPVGMTLDQAACIGDAANLNCSLPASDGIKGNLPIGVVPIATSALNVLGATGVGTTIGQLSLGTDPDGIGGTPMDNGPFEFFNANFDMTSITIVAPAAVPVPAAVWLFGSGLLGLVGVARRRKMS